MTKSKLRKKPNRSTIVTGGVLLIIPPLIALWVALEGRGLQDEPVRATFEQSETAASPTPQPTPDIPATPTTLPPKDDGHVIAEALLPAVAADAIYQPTLPAHWDSDTIYEKINGAAPEYFDVGFRELLTQE